MNLISVGVNYHDTIIKIYELNKKPDELMNWHDKRAKERGHILLFVLIACPARIHETLLIHSFFLSFQLKIKIHSDEQADRHQAGRQANKHF